jgi:L-2-hydroxyglutarate oxidase LhgO
MERVDSIVVGAGVVGLAIARALARAGREVVILEAEGILGAHASSRNSEVLHAGLYYPPDSLKARLCVAGRPRLVRYCAQREIGYRRVGKLVVATEPGQHERLERIHDNARRCGVDDLRLLAPEQVQTMEPELRCTAALWSPSTGIIDSHGLLRALVADAEAGGATLALRNAFVCARATHDGLVVEAGDARVQCRTLVNTAGLHAQAVAQVIEGLPPDTIAPRHLCKGTYFTLAIRSPFRHLVYPVPDTASLGIHLTLDLAGGARFGPDQQWVDAIDYAVDPSRGASFYPAIRTWWPGLPDDALTPGYAGIRTKVNGPGKSMGDFAVQGPAHHGIPGLVCLYGIESPGLTACLALADHVLELLAISPAPDDTRVCERDS